MALIEWNGKLSLDIPDIDTQHKKLISIINELHDAMKARRGRDVLKGLLVELFDYTDYHFSTEEGYFRTYRYPGSVVHKSEHDLLRTQVAELKRRFDNGDQAVTIETMSFLKDWLTDHILVSDHKYVPFLRENAAAARP